MREEEFTTEEIKRIGYRTIKKLKLWQRKIELKNEVKELKKGVQCVSCKNSNHKIVDRKVYCILKKKMDDSFCS